MMRAFDGTPEFDHCQHVHKSSESLGADLVAIETTADPEEAHTHHPPNLQQLLLHPMIFGAITHVTNPNVDSSSDLNNVNLFLKPHTDVNGLWFIPLH